MSIQKRISILTLHDVPNYGSVLQTFATQEIFKRLGLITNIIDYRRLSSVSLWKRVQMATRNDSLAKKAIKSILYFFYLWRQDKVFGQFRNDNISSRGPVLNCEDDFDKLQIDADIYCTGSDQTWNSGWYGRILKSYFLTFCPDNIKKISYAASFGKTSLEDSEKEEIRKYLLRYAAISLREESGVKIIEELGISGSVHVLDPTLQLDAAFWHRYIRKPSEEHYVLVYQLNKHPWFNDFAESFARQKGLKLIRFGANVHQIFKSGKLLFLPEPFDFPSYIAFADYVITDSFHATAFSLNLNTTPICIYPDRFSGRIEDLLKLTNLERLHVINSEDWRVMGNDPVNWEEVNAIFARYRRIGDDFLYRAIE